MSDPEGYTPLGLPGRVRDAARARGVRPVVGDFARWGVRLAAGLPAALRDGRGAPFAFEGERYEQLHGLYKRTWTTERAVEVPIIRRVVERHGGGRVLEVGNVLGHYGPVRHEVVDKYEQGPGVVNRDVLELGGMGPYDLVVTISTLEHVGWDEEPREPGRALAALEALRRLLAPGGRLVFTHPVGYNPHLDAALRDGRVALDHRAALRRPPGTRAWRQVSARDVWDAPYDFLLYAARGVLVGTVERGQA